MKKNNLSVWTFPYRTGIYIRKPWTWFKDLYWNIRNFWHRGRYGYAFVDVWDFCTWYPRVGAEALRYLAKHSSSYPGISPWNTPKKWEEFLLQFARNLDECAKSIDMDYSDNKNEYAKEFYNMKTTHHRHENPDGTITVLTELTPEQQEVRNKYFEREKELQEEYKQMRINTYAKLGEILDRVWD